MGESEEDQEDCERISEGGVSGGAIHRNARVERRPNSEAVFHRAFPRSSGSRRESTVTARKLPSDAMSRKAAIYEPQLATLVADAPRGDEWLHEIKLDGYRIGCVIDDGRVRLISRNGNDWTARFPTIAEAARKLRAKSASLDGEVVVLLPDGRTSFQALQNAFGKGPARYVVYFVFDLLALDGRDVATGPLEERKKKLAALVRRLPGSVIRCSDHTIGDGERVLAEACRPARVPGCYGVRTRSRG